MADMTKTIAPKSDQMNADDLIGGPMTISITKVSLLAGDQPVAISFAGDNGKPYKPCKSMRRVLVQVWGGDGTAYIGRSMTLYRDEKVVFGGSPVGGIRISHMSNISEPITMALTATRASRKPFTVKPLGTNGTAVAADPATIAAGNAAASQGVDAYKEWLNTLTPEKKAGIKSMHGVWSATAKEFDKTRESAAPPVAVDMGDGADVELTI
jgi:hypothetical protein